jgi:DNA-binding IclR family transcriptional regulator
MAGLDRFVEILRLFDADKPDWTIQEMADAVSVPASTVYRTVRELVGQGFLDPSVEAHYRLGAAIIEFDRRKRMADPLIREGEPVLRDVVNASPIPCVAVLARLYRNQVICVADYRTQDAEIFSSYERGRPMPLMRGATSKAILAQLPKARLGKILAGVDNLGIPMDEVATELAAIRRQGYAITRGEVDEGLVGIAVPLACPEAAINASMSLIVRAADSREAIERRLLMTLTPAAGILAGKLKPDKSD